MAKIKNKGWTYRVRVDKKTDGWTILEFYTQRYTHSSREVWKTHIEEGRVRLNGEQVSPETPIKIGQHLTYERPSWTEPDAPRSMEVLHADDDILLVNKPSGLPVLPGGNFLDNTLLSVAREQFGNVDPIHRLGRGTTGIVLFARTDIARTKLSADLREGRIDKVYHALASGNDVPQTFDITQPIGRIPYPKIGYLYAATDEGKASHTVGHVLHRTDQNTLCHIDLITGRPHQIRIHLAAIGHPLVGDPLYAPGGLPRAVNDDEPRPFPGDCGYHLHATKLTFAHPQTGDTFISVCPPPEILTPP